MPEALLHAVREAREALWHCAVLAAEEGNLRVETACDKARWAVNDFAELAAGSCTSRETST